MVVDGMKFLGNMAHTLRMRAMGMWIKPNIIEICACPGLYTAHKTVLRVRGDARMVYVPSIHVGYVPRHRNRNIQRLCKVDVVFSFLMYYNGLQSYFLTNFIGYILG